MLASRMPLRDGLAHCAQSCDVSLDSFPNVLLQIVQRFSGSKAARQFFYLGPVAASVFLYFLMDDNCVSPHVFISSEEVQKLLKRDTRLLDTGPEQPWLYMVRDREHFSVWHLNAAVASLPRFAISIPPARRNARTASSCVRSRGSLGIATHQNCISSRPVTLRYASW